MLILSASRPIVNPSKPSRLARSSATSRIAARVSSPLRMYFCVVSVKLVATGNALSKELQVQPEKTESNVRTIMHRNVKVKQELRGAILVAPREQRHLCALLRRRIICFLLTIRTIQLPPIALGGPAF